MTTPENKRIVGVSELLVSNNPTDVLVTYALGSCLGITIHDHEQHVGGLLHALLPIASLNSSMAGTAPATFVDTGVDLLLQECLRLGARRSMLTITAAGGAETGYSMVGDKFRVGYFNVLELRHTLKRHGLRLHHSNTGGHLSRNVSLAIETGRVRITTNTRADRVA